MIICKYLRHKTLVLNLILREGLEAMQWHALAEPQGGFRLSTSLFTRPKCSCFVLFDAGVSDHVMRMLSLMVCISFELRGSSATGTVIAKLVENVFQGYLDYLPVLPPTLPAMRQCETDVRFVEITCVNHLTKTAATLLEAISHHTQSVLPPQKTQGTIIEELQLPVMNNTPLFICR